MKRLVPHNGKGKELNDLLRRELGIPEGVTSFNVRFEVNKPILVECSYLIPEPADKDALDVTTLADTSMNWMPPP